MKLNYRKDIDGLRAIAVLAVLLNHANIPGFSGGYVGVDVFFVISGFLITAIIAREIEGGEFTFSKFYERRIRRILPALSVVTLFVLLASFVLFDAEKLHSVGKSLIATTLFYSNINFWMEAGYFDAPSQLKPLLHTWSLAVEEQFYIIFPVFMIILYLYAKQFKNLVLIFVFGLSLGFAIYQSKQDTSAAFYLVQYRMWELLTGALLSLNIIPAFNAKKFNNILGLGGLALLSAPIFLYSENTLFPGLNAIPPVLGTALVIYSNSTSESASGKLLGFPALVFIGKISYSLYLWHWPILVFFRYYLILPETVTEQWLIIFGILLVSTASWRFIETPFRSQKTFNTQKIYILAAGAMSFVLFLSGTIYYFDGLLTNAGLINKPSSKEAEGQWLLDECNINYVDNPKEILTCKVGDKTKVSTFMIWGDSHTPALGKAANDASKIYSLSGVITYAQGCPPYMGMIPTPSHGDLPCDRYNEMVIGYLNTHPEIKTVILVSRMTLYLEGTPYKQEEGVNHTLTDTRYEAPEGANSEILIRLGLERTVQSLKSMNRNIYIVVPIPEVGYDVPSANFIASRTGRDINNLIAPTLDEYLARSERTRLLLDEFKNSHGVELIEPWKTLCQESICRVSIDGIPLYFDDDHLSVFGSEVLTPVFEPIFAGIK